MGDYRAICDVIEFLVGGSGKSYDEAVSEGSAGFEYKGHRGVREFWPS